MKKEKEHLNLVKNNFSWNNIIEEYRLIFSEEI